MRVRPVSWLTGIVGALAVAGAAWGSASSQDPPSTQVVRIQSVNMHPRLKLGERVEFDLRAFATQDPAVKDIVLIRPPEGALAPETKCGRPRKPAGRLCIEPSGGPAAEPTRFVVRVVAVGGDRIRFRRGRAIRNGKAEKRRGDRCGRQDGCTYRRAIRVPSGHVYVAGDNRGSSDDSRFWGAVPNDQVVGRYLRMVDE